MPRALLALGLALTLSTCQDGMGPRVRYARVAIAPVLPSDANVASFGLVIDRVRLVVVRPATDTLADTTVVLPPDSAALDLELRVPLFSAAETLQVSIIALSGSIPLFEGSAPVEVRTGGVSAPTTIPVLTYIGPGAGVDSIVVTPPAPFIYLNDSLRFQVQAFQAGIPVPQFYVAWSTSDSTVARISSDGTLRAPATRTSVRVVARTPGGVSAAVDSTTVTFVPLPTQLVIIAGNGQTGVVSQPLATELEVEVRAADNLPVGGVAVRFRSLAGGTPADTTIVSDAFGRVRVTGVLGPTPGPQSFQATLPAFPAIAAAGFGATATSGAIAPSTSLLTVSNGSVASGNNITLRLRGRDISGNNVSIGGATVAFSFSGGTSTGSIGVTADSGNGVYTATFTGVLAGTATTIGATVNGVPVTTALPTVAVSPGVISRATSQISVSSGGVASGGIVTLRLRARDAAGNNLTTGGAVVAFTYAGGTSTGVVGATVDSANGVYTATFLADVAGTATTIGATINGVPVTSTLPTVAVTPGGISAATSTITVDDDTSASGLVVTLTLQARDAQGNPLTAGGDTVVFTRSGGTSTGAIGSTTDNGDGTYRATFTGQVAGTATTIGATVNGIPVTTPLPTITVTAGTITTVTLSPPGAALVALGATQQLTAVATDTGGNVVPTTFTWSSSVGAVAGVNGSGLVTASGNGTTVITATAIGGKSGTATINVQQIVAIVQVTPASDTAHAFGVLRAFTAVARDANDSVVGGESFTWQSSDTATAAIHPATGVATSAGNGTTIIRATAASNGTFGTGTLVVAQVAASVTVTPASVTLRALGASQTFTAAALDSNGFAVVGAAFAWASSDTVAVAVDGAGVATAIANGTATITASTAGVSGNASLTVTQVATQVAFMVEPSTVAAGTAIAPPVEVAAVDSLGSPVAGYTDSITVAIGTNPSGGVLAGALFRTPLLGTASFADLRIDQPGSGYTLTASAPGLAGAVSQTFDVAPPGSTAFWANPAGGNWSVPSNWSGGVVPGLGDTAIINLAGTYTVTLDVSDTVGGLRIGGGTGVQTLAISAAPRTLGIGGAMRVEAGGVFATNASTLTGPGTLTNLGTIRLRTTTVNKPVDNRATLLVDGTNTLGSLATTAASFIRVQGNGQTGFSQLTVSTGFTNAGRIELTDSSGAHGSRLTVSGTLVNASGGVIEALPGALGTREVAAVLDNQGTLAVSHPLTLNASGADHVNSGAIVVSGGTLTLNQAGTTPSFTTTGSVAIGAGRAFSVSAGTFNYAGGSIGGLGTLALANLTANFTQSFSNDTLALTLTTTTLNGPGTLSVTPGDTLRVRTSTLAAPLVNQGALLFDGSSSITGSFSTATASVLRIQGNGQTGFSQVTVSSGFTNAGRIELTDSSGAHGSRLTVSSGMLINASGGVIEAMPGAGGSRELTAALDNQAGGSLAVSHPLTLNPASADHQNAGSILVAGGNFVLNQSGTTPSFTTSGTVAIAAGRTFTVNGGTFDYAGGSVGGRGTIAFASVTANFTQSFSNDTLFLTLATSTLNGPGTVTVTPDDTLRVRTSTIAAPLVNQGVVLFDGSNNVTGSFSAAAGSKLRVQGNGQTGLSQLTVASGFTNSGTIELTDSSGAHGARLTVSAGTLVNASGGVIASLTGAGGSRELTAALDNQAGGSLALGHNLLLNGASADHLNAGTIAVSGGSLTLNQTGTTPTFTTTGAIVVDSGRAFNVNAGTFDFAGGSIGGRGTLGLANTVLNLTPAFTVDTLSVSLLSVTVNGPGTLTVAAGRTLPVRSSIFNAPFVNQGSVLVGGATTVNGALTAAGGSLIRVQGNGQVGASQLTVATAGGFTNDGQLLLTDSSGAHGATLLVSGGPLVNGSTGVIRADTGAGGTRTLAATLANQGLMAVAMGASQVLTVNVPSAAHQNSGTLSLVSGTLTVMGAGSSFTNTATGLVEGRGTFNTAATSFVNNGALNPGTPAGSAGVLTVAGAYSQGTGALHVELGGTAVGTQYDRLAVSGTASLGGALTVTLAGGFTPALGDTFTVMTFGSRSGAFPTVNGLLLGGGLTLDTIYTATSLRLVVAVFQTLHSGDITTDESWSAAQSPHVVSGPVRIVNGATLTIEDGATVKFSPLAGLQVGDSALGQAGGLAMLGTPGGIRLTANTATPVPGFWTGLEVQKALAPIVWRNVDIEYGGGPRANPFNEACILLVDPTASVELDSVHIRRCVHAGVHHFAGTARVHRSVIDSVTGSGIHSDFAGVLRLDSTTIRGSGEEGLFVAASSVDLASAVGNRFVGNAVAGVHLLAHHLAGFGRQDSIIDNGFGPGGVGDSIVVDSGTVATNVPAFTIFRQPAPYLVTGFITIASPAGQEVSLDTGLVMAFDTLAALSIGDFADAAGNTSGVSARVVSLGTAASPVVLRNRLGRPGWTGLYLGAQTGTPVVRHLRLVNGGYQAGGAFCSNCQVLVQGGFEPLSANLYIDAPIGSAPFAIDSVVSDSSRFRGIIIKRTPPAGLQLRNSSVTNSSSTGLVVLADYNPADTIAGNTFSGNGNPLDIGAGALPALGANGIGPHVSDTLWLRGGTLIASDTLPDYPGSPWYVFRALAIDSGAALTVLPGDTVLFGDSVAFAIGGAMPSALHALGTAASPIVFTSVPGRGPWLGMEFVNLSSSTVQHLIVENAGRSLPCFGDCNPIPVAAVRYVNASGSGLTLDGVTIRQSVTMALLVDSAAASPLAIVNSQFYANPYSPMIKSRNPTLLSIHGSDLYHYNAQIIQTLNANTDSIDATDNWWGDVAGLARGFEFSDSLGRASLWFNAVRFAPMSAAPHFPVGAAARIVAARDTVLNSGYGLNAVIGDPDSIRARVLDAAGRGVVGYDVQWGTSTGFVSFLSSLTDAGGRVGSVWTTSTVAGDQLVQAVGPGLSGSPVNWRTTLQPGPTVSTNWQLVPSLTQGTVSAGLDTAYFTSANRASALVSNAVDAFGNRTTPTSGFFFSTVPNTGFQFPPFGQLDSIHGDTVFFRVLVSNPTLYQVHGLYDGGLIQDSLFLSVTAAPAGIRIAQDSAVFTSICPVDPANAFCEQRFWAEVVDSSGAPLPPSDSYTFTWSRDPGTLITIARTTGLAQDTVFVTARANGTTWVTVDETQQGTLVPSHDSLPIRIQQVTASVTVVPDTISARIGDNLTFDGTPRDQGGTPTADTIHWAEDFAGTLAFLDTTSVFNQATVRLIGTSFGTTNVLAIVNGVNLGFAQVYNPVQGLIPGVGNETNGVVVNAGLVYVATDTGVAMIDQSDRVSTFIPIPEPTYYLAHDRANNRIYAGARFSSTIYVIDGFTNTLQRSFQVNGFFVPQFAVDESTGNLLVPTVVCVGTPACVNVDFLGVFNSDGGLVDTIPIGDQGIALAFDQAARKVFVGVFAGPLDSIKVIDLAQRKAVDSIEVGSSLANLAFNPVTRLLYASDYNDNTVHVIDGTTHQVRSRVFVGSAPEGIAIDTVRNRIYVANTGDPTVYVIDGETDAVVQFISVAVPTSQAAVWQGGNQLYVNSFGRGDVRVLKF